MDFNTIYILFNFIFFFLIFSLALTFLLAETKFPFHYMLYAYNFNLALYGLFVIINMFYAVIPEGAFESDFLWIDYIQEILTFFFYLYLLLIRRIFLISLNMFVLGLINIIYLASICLFYVENFVLIFLFLEIISFSSIFLILTFKKKIYNIESALKYFIISAISSLFILFGFIFLYWQTGEYNLSELRNFFFEHERNLLSIIGLIFISLGLFFKLGLFPYINWILDIYEGCEMHVTFFFLSILKLIYTLFFFNIIYFYFYFLLANQTFCTFCAAIAFISIVLGVFYSLVQVKIKKFMASASITHSGFLLLIILVNLEPYSALFYLFFYIFSVYFLFNIILNHIYWNKENENQICENIIELQYIANKSKFWHISLAFSFLNFAGIPPLIGFFMKFNVFGTLIINGYWFFVILTLILNAIAFIYYLRITNSWNVHNKKNIRFFKNVSKNTIFLNIIFFIICISFIFYGNILVHFIGFPIW